MGPQLAATIVVGRVVVFFIGHSMEGRVAIAVYKNPRLLHRELRNGVLQEPVVELLA